MPLPLSVDHDSGERRSRVSLVTCKCGKVRGFAINNALGSYESFRPGRGQSGSGAQNVLRTGRRPQGRSDLTAKELEVHRDEATGREFVLAHCDSRLDVVALLSQQSKLH